MSETTENDTPNTPPNGKRKRRWIKPVLIGVLLVAIGLVPGFFIGARTATAWIWHGFGHHHYKFDSDRMAAKIDRRVDHVLSRVDATDEQKQKVGTIAKSALNDLSTLGVDPRETRRKFIELFRAETVDPAALEALRAEQIAKIDTGSKRLVQAMTEAATVLTPEQRRELTERWQRRHRKDR